MCSWGWGGLIVLHSHVGLPERLVTSLQLVSNSVAAIQAQMPWPTLIIPLGFNLSTCGIPYTGSNSRLWKSVSNRRDFKNHTFVTLPYSLLILFHHCIFGIFWIHPKGVYSYLSHCWLLLTKRQEKLFLKTHTHTHFLKIKVLSAPKVLFIFRKISIFSLLGIKHTSKY